MSDKLKALQYIVNTGGSISIEHFDEDHEPIGPWLRADLLGAGLIDVIPGSNSIRLSSKGQIAVHAIKDPQK